MFHHEGGVDIGDVDAKASKLEVPIDYTPTVAEIKEKLLTHVTGEKKEYVSYEMLVEFETNYVNDLLL